MKSRNARQYIPAKFPAKGIMLNVNSKFMKKTIEKLIWLMIKMKLMCLVIALATTSLNAEVWSQQEKDQSSFRRNRFGTTV